MKSGRKSAAHRFTYWFMRHGWDDDMEPVDGFRASVARVLFDLFYGVFIFPPACILEGFYRVTFRGWSYTGQAQLGAVAAGARVVHHVYYGLLIWPFFDTSRSVVRMARARCLDAAA